MTVKLWKLTPLKIVSKTNNIQAGLDYALPSFLY